MQKKIKLTKDCRKSYLLLQISSLFYFLARHVCFYTLARQKIKCLEIFCKSGFATVSIIVFIVLFLTSNFAFAADHNESEEVKNYLNNFGDKVIKIADDDKLTLDQKKEKLITLIDGATDARWMAKFVLAKYYRTANEEQIKRFMKLYRQFMIHNYGPKFQGYNGEKFDVIDVEARDKYYIVKVMFFPKTPPPVNLVFRIKKREANSSNNNNGNNGKNGNSSFVILDIAAEGISLIETQRSEFGAAIANNGLDNFLDDLERKVKQPTVNANK